MPVQQISLGLENIPGTFSKVIDCLEDTGINIIALSVVETGDISTIRFVASDPGKALNVLKSQGYFVEITDVLAVEAPDHPGGLNAVMKPLKETKINVSSLYACLRSGESTVLIVGVDRLEEAIQVLKKNWVQMYDEELYTLKV